MNDDQRHFVYETIMEEHSSTQASNLFFADASGGTGKNFFNAILTAFREEGNIAIAVASLAITS